MDEVDLRRQSPVEVSHYHMVGTWYFQTDGLEVPSWSTVEQSFFQCGDDCALSFLGHCSIFVTKAVTLCYYLKMVISCFVQPLLGTRSFGETMIEIHTILSGFASPNAGTFHQWVQGRWPLIRLGVGQNPYPKAFKIDETAG